MQREILFRGKRVDNGEWVYGYLVVHTDKSCSIISYADKLSGLQEWHEIIPESIGQWTGKDDKSGKHIFEGDINQDGGFVIWNKDDASFVWVYENIETSSFEREDEWCEIVGNIHSNPELMEGK